MKRLHRNSANEPECLAKYRHGADNWNDVTPEDREAIWIELHAMQGMMCAYCESSLDTFGKHIEHFKTRHAYPPLTFKWSNLLGSCCCCDSCGMYKDNGAGAYKPDDLLDPTVDDPDEYLEFRSDGSISVRGDLSERNAHRAKETLRVLNLDPEFGRWRQMRKITVDCYQAAEPGIVNAIMEFDEEDRREFIREEIARTSMEPFSAPIRQLFQGLY